MYAFMYLFLFSTVILVEFSRKKTSRIDTLSLFNLSFVMSYLMPAVMWALFPVLYESKLPYQLFYNAAYTKEVCFTLFFVYILFVCFYLSFKRVKFSVLLSFTPLNNKIRNSTNSRVLIIILFFSFIIITNIILVGGVNEYLVAGTEARHNKTQFGLAGYLNYFLSGTLFVILCSLFLLHNKKGIMIRILLLIVFVLLMIGLLARGGRGAIVEIFLGLLLYYYYRNSLKFNVRGLVLLLSTVFFSFFVIFFLRKISDNLVLERGLFEGIDLKLFFSTLGEVAIYPFQYFAHYLFVLVEFFKDPDIYNYPRLGADHLSAMVLLVPSLEGTSLGLPILPDIISQDIMGKYNGYIPPGWIGWALIDGGLWYLFFKLFFSAIICLFFDKSYKFFKNTDIGKLIYFILIIFVVDFLFEVTAMNLFRGSVGHFLFFLLILIIPSLRVGKLSLIKV